MNKLLVGLLALGSFSALAGTIENRQTDEIIDFRYDKINKTVLIDAHLENERIEKEMLESEFIDNLSFKIKELGLKDPEVMGRAFGATQTIHEYFGDEDRLGSAAFTPITVVGDILLLPITLPRSLKNNKYFVDYRIARKALVHIDKNTNVSDKRFKRILDTLNIEID